MRGYVAVNMGGMRLRIPEKNLDISGESWLTSGLDTLARNTDEINVRFGVAQLRSVPGLPAGREVVGTLKYLDSDAMARSVAADRDMAELLWSRRGRFRSYDQLTRVRGSPFWRMSGEPGSKISFWEIVRMPPLDGNVPSDPFGFWIASCNGVVDSKTGMASGGSCLTHLYVGEVRLRFWLDEELIPAIDSLRTFLTAEIHSWIENDHSKMD